MSKQAVMVTNNFQKALQSEPIKNRFSEVLDKGAAGFMSSLLTVYNGNSQLQKCTTKSILGAAGLAATMKLPIIPSLGYAYIVPYGNEAQFQIGTKGLVQLAHRTGHYKKIHTGIVREGEICGFDVLTGDAIVGEKISEKIVGYVAYMELINGFNKTFYMTVAEIEEHAKKYSQSYAYDLRSGKKTSVWSTNFDAMAKKTVLKLLLKNWGVMSAEMQEAIRADQSVVDKNSFRYVDNSNDTVQREPIEVSDGEIELLEENETPFADTDPETGEILTKE